MPNDHRRSPELHNGLYGSGDSTVKRLFQNTGFGYWREGQIAETLRTPAGGDAMKANLVVTYGIDHVVCGGGNCTAQGPCYYKEISPTLKAGGAHGVAIIQEYGICDGISTSAYNSNEGGCPTLNASHEQPIYVGSQKGRSGITEDGTATTLTSQEKERPIVGTSAVRRLTPLECERLQGFPDGWTDIGEWTDTKGKKHKEADSPRYKALGNSIALPFWFYLLRRISATYERPATLGSLFDGIGGFPLCWERCNGKGTAVWASEIEEFPIAVTKIRFPE